MSEAFAKAMEKGSGRTENGAVTNVSSGSEVLDLFFQAGAARSWSDAEIADRFRKAAQENFELAMRLLLWARDVRGGAGERRFFRVVLEKMASIDNLFQNSITQRVIDRIPEIGRWDDILVVFNTDNRRIKTYAASVIRGALNQGDGLCAKWMPRNKAPAAEIRAILGFTPKQWRKTLVGLTEVVEQKMCAKKFEYIEFGKLPSLASARYTNAFMRNAPEEYGTYLDKLQKGKEKVNAGAIFPHDVVRTLRRGNATLASEQWKELPDFMESSEGRTIVPVCDVSGSMSVPVSGSIIAMDISIALSLYVAERNRGPFKDRLITFHHNPKVVRVSGNLNDRYNATVRMPWGGNTDVEAVFDLILDRCVNNSLSQEDVPEMVLIVSDMEFDAARGAFSLRGLRRKTAPRETLFESIEAKWRSAGYKKMPKLVFWNVNARNTNNMPKSESDDNCALISGYSPSIIKPVLEGDPDQFSPTQIMLDTLMVDRYAW